MLPPCGKAVAYYVVEDAHGRKGITDFRDYESLRHRMDEIKKVSCAAASAKGRREPTTMQSTIRIIKRNECVTTNSLPADQSDRTDRQRERDTANTVKSWVAEWEARNRLVQAAAFSLLRSLENRSESSTRRLAVVKG